MLHNNYIVGILLYLGLCLTVNSQECYEKKSVIIDTDAGSDDAMAILMLLSSDCVQVEAITCVQGNTGIKNVSINVLKVLDIAGRLDIPVYVGNPSGLVYDVKSDNYFGEDGLGDFRYPNPPDARLLRKQFAPITIARKVSEKPGVITLICLGPLTNIALASLINPNFFSEVKQILILGGSHTELGNVGPGQEFNMWADPEAAESFFRRVPPTTETVLIPIETNSDIAFSLEWRIDVLGRLPSRKMEFLNLAERKSNPKNQNWTPFDQNVAITVLYPNVVTNFEIGQPIVNTATDKAERGVMKINFGEGSVKVITKLDKSIIKMALRQLLS